MKRLCLPVLLLAPLLFALSAAAAAFRDAVPVPEDNPMTPAKIELGRRLFYDADLSVNGTMSCATCHEQKHGFADGNRTHPGALDDAGRRNVPGLANVAWLQRLTWADPAQTSLEAQVAVPVFGDHPVEMAMKGHESEIARRLERDPCYVEMFRQAFPESRATIGFDQVAKAIATFERTLISEDTSYDRFVRGDVQALSRPAQQGLRIFQQDCAFCHAGPALTDAQYHRIVPQEGPAPGDVGLAEATQDPADAGRFRTPGLRNVGVTAPYLHDGSANSLADAIRAHDAFRTIRPSDLALLLAFLSGLTDQRFLSNPDYALPLRACGKAL